MLAWEALTRVLEGLVEDIITIIMVVGDLVWEWVVVMGIMDIMEGWVDLGLVGIMEVGLVDTMEDIMVEEGLVGIMVVDIKEGAGDLFLLTGVMVCVFCCEFWDVADEGRLEIHVLVWL